jgi:hypothetical protein
MIEVDGAMPPSRPANFKLRHYPAGVVDYHVSSVTGAVKE